LDEEFKKFDNDYIISLSICSIEMRYPSENEEPTLQEVEQFYNFATQIGNFIKNKIDPQITTLIKN
jgi:hypothetical protein